MEKVDDGCGSLRITPSGARFGSRDSWVMGDIFLQNYYSIYDYSNSKVGLIEAKGSHAS